MCMNVVKKDNKNTEYMAPTETFRSIKVYCGNYSEIIATFKAYHLL